MNILELKRKAVEYESQGDFKKALKLYQQILKHKSDEIDSLIRIGQILLRLKQDKKAADYLLKAARLFEKKGIYNNRLVAVYKKLIQIYPERYELLERLAEAYYHVGMVGEAGKTLENYIEYLFKKGDYEEVFKCYEKLLSWQPSNFALKERVADLYITFKKNEKAQKLLIDLLSYYSTRNKTKEKEIKEKLYSLGLDDAQIEKLLKERINKKKKKGVFVTLDDLVGEGVGERGEYEEEVETEEKTEVEKTMTYEEKSTQKTQEEKVEGDILPKIDEIKPEEIKSIKAAKSLAESLLLLGDYTGALDAYYSAYELCIKEHLLIDAYKILKEIAEKWPEELKARREMVKVANMLKNRELLSDSIFMLAECLYKRGAKEESLEWFLKALKFDPDNKKAKEYVSIISPEKLKEFEKRRKTRKTEIKKKVEKVKAHVKKQEKTAQEKEKFIDFAKMIKEELEKEEEKGGVLEEVRESLHHFSKEVDYKGKLELGIAMREMGLYEDAILNLKEAAKGKETRVEALELLGMTFMEMSRYELAIEYFEEALKEKDIDERRKISIEYHIAQCYENIKDYANALAYYKRVFEKDPNIKGLKEKIKELEEKGRDILDEDRISFL